METEVIREGRKGFMQASTGTVRLQAVVSWIGAALLLGLILWLAAIPSLGAFDDVLSVGSVAAALVVFALLYGDVRERGPWAMVMLVLGIAGLTLVLAGDALQHVVFHDPSVSSTEKETLWAVTFALRDLVGNGLSYACFIVLGSLLVGKGWRWVGALAIANGVLGYLDLAVAPTLGLPPHVNFLLFVVWEILLGVTWWRRGSRAGEKRADNVAVESGVPSGLAV
jgi:hypothetical protein